MINRDHQMTIKEKATWLSRGAFLACVAATVLGTINARNGDWNSWAIDCVIFAVAAMCALVNLRLARRS